MTHRNVANEDRLAWSIAQSFTLTHARQLSDASTSSIKFRARLAELLADLRAGKFHPSTPETSFPDVARKLVLWAIEGFDEMSACPCCTLGHEPVDPDDPQPHDEGCPLIGFEKTRDVEALRAWASGENKT